MKIKWLLLLPAILLVGCNTGKRLANNIDPNSIPADLRKESYILLLQKQEDGVADHQNRLTEGMSGAITSEGLANMLKGTNEMARRLMKCCSSLMMKAGWKKPGFIG